MAVSAGYLAKFRTAARLKSTAFDAELTDYIEEARRDLESLGVLVSKTTDETNELIRGAIRCYVRWKYAATPEDEAGNRDDYEKMRDELRHKRECIGYTITFSVTASGSPLADAEVTFNGSAIATGATGTAIFYGVSAGTNQEYTVVCDGYATVTADYDVSATATVSVAMTAG